MLLAIDERMAFYMHFLMINAGAAKMHVFSHAHSRG